MKQRHITELLELHEHTPKSTKALRAKLPTAATTDRVSRIIWGIRPEQDGHHHVCDFLQYAIATQRHVPDKREAGVWKKTTEHILWNPGMAFEYFLVDYLLRNQQNFAHIFAKRTCRVTHRKTWPHQDSDQKVDFLSILTTKFKEHVWSLRFGIQLTTTRSRAHSDEHDETGGGNFLRKMHTTQHQSNQITSEVSGKQSPYPATYTPDLCAYMVVNSHINKLINSEGNNIFETAFSEWKEKWFPEWWPCPFLPKDVKTDMYGIATVYMHSLLYITQFLEKQIEAGAKTYQDLEWLVQETREESGFSIQVEFDPMTRQFLSRVFINKNDPLCGMYFFINEHTLQKVRNYMQKKEQ